ncbi:uncharacterized protein LOC106179956 [Lingula anatina]|uniref:Uncharacterized protein LOC106179956 n=1 Tax=Lingula anatina TaxID=7574 RepID=A0A1S3K9R3_LINAN|nr:uncharacterized protein LOC106179956 [Lingula anatina]|eukprot:XP_013419237.1 uncharacterized protein LOC106179956 [Lingula anatina]
MRGFEIWLAVCWVTVSLEKRTLALAKGGCFEEYAEVYQETYLRAEPVVTHVSVTQSCGIFGWGRCRVQRRITKTRHVTATRLATRLRKRCCENWTGELCDQSLITSTVSSSPSTTPTSTMTRPPPIIVTVSKSPGTSSEHSSTSFRKPTKVLIPTQDLWPSTGTESTPGLSGQTTARGTPGTNSTVKAPATPTLRPTPILTPMPTALRPSPTGLRPTTWPGPTPSSTPIPRPSLMPSRTAEPTPTPQTPRRPTPTKGPGPQPTPMPETPKRPTPSVFPGLEPTPWIPPRTAGPTPMPETPKRPTPSVFPGLEPTPWIPPRTVRPTPMPATTLSPTPSPSPRTAVPRPGTVVTPSPSTVTPQPKPPDKTPSSWTDVPTRYVPDQGSGVTHFNVSVTSSWSPSLQTSPTTSATTHEEKYTTTTLDARGEWTTAGDKGHLTSPSVWSAVTTAGETDGVTPTLIHLSSDVTISFLSRNISEELLFLCEFDFHRPFDSKTCELKWLRHGQRISKISSRFHENFYSGKGRTRFLNVLKISPLNRTDVGEYVCVASTQTASSNVSVEIRELLVSEPLGTNEPFHIDNRAAIATITGLALLFVVTVVVLPWVVYQKRFIIKLRAKRYFGKYEDTDDKLYDVFVSYCPDSVDEIFVVRTLVPKLEQTYNMRVCVDYKEFLPGEVLSVSVIEAVESSRRTILVLSPRFIENGWCRFHFLSAQLEMLQSKHSIIPLIYEDISKISSTDKDLRNILKIAKPVRWPSERRPRTENNFWDHLHLLLPKKRKPASGFRVNFSRWVFASNKVDYVSTDLSYDNSRPKSRSERSNGVISPADFTDLKLHIEDIV